MSLPQLIEDLQRLSEDQDSADVVFICGRDERSRTQSLYRD